MSLPIQSPVTGQVGSTGIDPSTGGASLIEQGQNLGQMSADLELQAISKASNLRANGVNLVLAIEQHRKDAVQSVINSI